MFEIKPQSYCDLYTNHNQPLNRYSCILQHFPWSVFFFFSAIFPGDSSLQWLRIARGFPPELFISPPRTPQKECGEDAGERAQSVALQRPTGHAQGRVRVPETQRCRSTFHSVLLPVQWHHLYLRESQTQLRFQGRGVPEKDTRTQAGHFGGQSRLLLTVGFLHRINSGRWVFCFEHNPKTFHSGDPFWPTKANRVFHFFGLFLVFGHRFILTDADLYVLNYMENNPGQIPLETLETLRQKLRSGTNQTAEQNGKFEWRTKSKIPWKFDVGSRMTCMLCRAALMRSRPLRA